MLRCGGPKVRDWRGFESLSWGGHGANSLIRTESVGLTRSFGGRALRCQSGTVPYGPRERLAITDQVKRPRGVPLESGRIESYVSGQIFNLA